MTSTAIKNSRLSVAVCTWNRAHQLSETLTSIATSVSRAPEDVTVLIVDNNSTDSTAAVAQPWVESGAVKYIVEEKAGLSNARNRAVKEAHSEWILFLDDDVRIDESFISRYLAVLDDRTSHSFFGGPILPVFDGPDRSWTSLVLEQFPWCYSCIDIGNPSRPFEPGQFPFGANMCIRRSMLEALPFSSDFGYRHGELIPGEETFLFRRLTESGASGYWISECKVLHLLPAQRNTLRYLFRRAFGQGVSGGLVAAAMGLSRRWVLRDLVSSGLLTAGAAFARSPKIVPNCMRVLMNIGFLIGPWFPR